MADPRAPFIVKNLIKLKKDVGRSEEFDQEIKLIANSGIQFIDYELDSEIKFDEPDEGTEDYYANFIKRGMFKLLDNNNEDTTDPNLGHYARYYLDKSENFLIIDKDLPMHKIEVEQYQKTDNAPSMQDSLNLYNGVWFPVPFCNLKTTKGPCDFARARIVNLSGKNGVANNKGRYHVTFAFDTKVDDENRDFHSLLTSEDLNDALSFRIGIEATNLLRGTTGDGTSFTHDWVRTILEKIYPKTTTDKKESYKANPENESKDSYLNNKRYEMDYLNVLAFIDNFFKPNNIRFVHFDRKSADSDSAVDVSLVLDVGNTRTCGLLVELDNSSDHNGDSFPNSRPLMLRDLNAPENYYYGAFESRIQFQMANFDFNRCSKGDTFIWPSLVRIGTEASKLSALLNGDEGNTGLISPKRYLWKISEAENNTSKKPEWIFNDRTYQIPVFKRDDDTWSEEYFYANNEKLSAIYKPVNNYLNSQGDALFAQCGSDSKLKANYTGKSTMTFMLMEIILQAMMQMNSYNYRKSLENSSLPRKLKSLVLTTPPSMSDIEKEIFRSCAYQAIGIIWKSLGYDKSPSTEFKFVEKKDIFPSVPEIYLKWDETLAGQIVYWYNQTKCVYQGNSKDFIHDIRRADADGRFNENNKSKIDNYYVDNISARIASIDIGGGTTDLVIADYAFPTTRYNNKDVYLKKLKGEEVEKKDVKNNSNFSSNVNIREVLRDGFKIAGDDLVLDLLRKYVLPQLPEGQAESLVGSDSEKISKGVDTIQKRVQTSDKIFTKLTYRLLARIEQIDAIPYKSYKDNKLVIKGTIEDFLTGNEKFENDDLNNEEKLKLESRPLNIPESVREYIEKQTDVTFDEFMQKELSFDLNRINYEISRGEGFDLCNKCLDYLNSIVNVYRCDVLLLSGGPSKLPGLRSIIERKSSLSPKRIISMHNYKCPSWYPAFDTVNGRISDPKTSVVVGALLGYTKTNPSKLISFKLNCNPISAISPMRFLGNISEGDLIKSDDVLYLFKSGAEKDIKKLNEQPDSALAKLKIGITCNDESKTKLTDIIRAVPNEREVHTNLSLKIGYRQFKGDSFGATPIYEIEPYSSAKELEKVKAISCWTMKTSYNFNEGELDEMKNEGLIKQMNTSGNRIAIDNAKIIENEYKSSREMIIEKLDFSNDPAYEELKAQAKAHADKAVSEMNLTGLGKIFGASKKKEELYKSEYDKFYAQEKAILDARLQEERDDEIWRITELFKRKVSSLVKESRDEIEKTEAEKLQNLKARINESHTFDLKITKVAEDDKAYIKNSAICQCLNFIDDQLVKLPCVIEKDDEDKSVIRNLFLIKIESAKDCADGTEGFEEYLNLRLKTVSSNNENYWNNTGLILG